MCLVIANVSKDPSAEDRCCSVPIVPEYRMCKLMKWHGKDNKERWWHDETIFVHWKVVVDAMEEEVGCQANTVVREVSKHRPY